MTIKGLRAFTRIMACGTLSAAARDLHTSESALSRQLSQLESELKLTLFSRHQSRLIPTEEGEDFFREAERLIDSFDQIPEIVSEIKERRSRRLRIIVMPRLADTIAVPAITRFLESHPDIDLTIEVQPRRFLERRVASRKFDLGIGGLPAFHAAIETEHICTVSAFVVLPLDHKLASRDSLRIEDLAGERFISMPSSSYLGRKLAHVMAEAGIVLKSPIQASQIPLCYQLVAKGHGITIADPIIPEGLRRAVKMVPIEPRIPLEFGLFFPRGIKHSKEVQHLVEVIREQAKSFVDTLPY